MNKLIDIGILLVEQAAVSNMLMMVPLQGSGIDIS